MIKTNDKSHRNPERTESRRTLRAALTGASSAVARAFQLAISLISIPLAIHYLGTERFGLWMTIFSLVNILNFADFGIGNGLLNAVAEAYGRNDSKYIREAVSSGFFVLFVLSVFFSVLFSLLYVHVDWPGFFRVHSPTAIHEAGPTAIVFFASFAVALPFGTAQRIQLAQQEGYINGIWSIIGTLIGFIGLCTAIHCRLGLPWLILSVAGGPSISMVANCVTIFWHRPCLRPSLEHVTRDLSKRLLKTGSLFFALQIAMAVGYQTDNIVITRIIGPESVASYSVALKVFQAVPTFLGFFMLALWPAYGEAMACGDYAWIEKIYRKSISLNFVIGVIAASLLFLSAPTLIRVWAGKNLEPSHLLLVALAGYCVTNTLIGPISAIMNGMNLLRFQSITWSLMAIANLTLSIYLTRSIGVSGVAFGSMITQAIFILCPSVLYLRKVLTQSRAA